MSGLVWLQEQLPKRHVFKRDWIVPSIYDNHSRVNNQHVWRELYDHPMSTKFFTSIMNKIFIRAPKMIRKVTMALIWICVPLCTNYMFHILGERGYSLAPKYKEFSNKKQDNNDVWHLASRNFTIGGATSSTSTLVTLILIKFPMESEVPK